MSDIHELECKCGSAVSGPDKKAVEATMARHKDKCKEGKRADAA
jgi:hypothetical protein